MESAYRNLKELYDNFKEQVKKGQLAKMHDFSKLTPPFLVCPSEKYTNSSTRVVIVGICTNGWGLEKGNYGAPYDMKTFREFLDYPSAVSDLMDHYKRFAQKEWGKPKQPNHFGQLSSELLGQHFPEAAWTNLYRANAISHDGRHIVPEGQCLNGLLELQRGLLIKELEILNPHLVIFFTSHLRDNVLGNEFGTQFERIPLDGFDDSKALCQLRLPIPMRSTTAFRTYHPGYLLRKRKKYESLIRVLKKQCTEARASLSP